MAISAVVLRNFRYFLYHFSTRLKTCDIAFDLVSRTPIISGILGLNVVKNEEGAVDIIEHLILSALTVIMLPIDLEKQVLNLPIRL